MATYAIGIDLGGTNIKAGLVEREQGLLQKKKQPTEASKGPEHVLDQVVSLVKNIRGSGLDATGAGIGVGCPGIINWERTTVSDPPNLPGWESVNVRAALRKRLGPVDVVVENDANVAALGSSSFGAGRKHDSFIMVTLGTGVGGAIVYHNQIFRGDSGAAGEIGHMTIDYEGPYANSGVAGAIEAYLGQTFLTRHARNRLVNHPESSLHDVVDTAQQDLTPRLLYDAARDGDEAAQKVLEWAGHKLGCVLGSAVNLLDIRTVVVGGGVSSAGSYILNPAREALPRFVVPGLRDELTVLREDRGNEVSLLGAAQLVLEGSGTRM